MQDPFVVAEQFSENPRKIQVTTSVIVMLPSYTLHIDLGFN